MFAAMASTLVLALVWREAKVSLVQFALWRASGSISEPLDSLLEMVTNTEPTAEVCVWKARPGLSQLKQSRVPVSPVSKRLALGLLGTQPAGSTSHRTHRELGWLELQLSGQDLHCRPWKQWCGSRCSSVWALKFREMGIRTGAALSALHLLAVQIWREPDHPNRWQKKGLSDRS